VRARKRPDAAARALGSRLLLWRERNSGEGVGRGRGRGSDDPVDRTGGDELEPGEDPGVMRLVERLVDHRLGLVVGASVAHVSSEMRSRRAFTTIRVSPADRPFDRFLIERSLMTSAS